MSIFSHFFILEIYIAENLKFLRKRKKLTQEDFAQAINNSRTNIAKWEGSTLPEMPTIIQIAEFFNVHPGDLLFERFSVNESLLDTKRRDRKAREQEIDLLGDDEVIDPEKLIDEYYRRKEEIKKDVIDEIVRKLKSPD